MKEDERKVLGQKSAPVDRHLHHDRKAATNSTLLSSNLNFLLNCEALKVCSCAVPRGSVLGPSTRVTCHAPCLTNAFCLSMTFPSFSSAREPRLCAETLSSATSNLVSPVEELGLQLNISKTKGMFVMPRAATTLSHDLDPLLRPIPWQCRLGASYKYLGVHIDCELNWHAHINHVMKPPGNCVRFVQLEESWQLDLGGNIICQ